MFYVTKSLMSHLELSTARSVRLVVACISYSEMTESSELKEVAEVDLLDASCVYINWEQTKPAIIGVSR